MKCVKLVASIKHITYGKYKVYKKRHVYSIHKLWKMKHMKCEKYIVYKMWQI